MSKLILDVESFSTGTERSDPFKLSDNEPRSIGVHFKWSAALSASILVEVSNDPALGSLVAQGGNIDSADWVDYSSEVTMINEPAGGAERNGAVNVSFFGFEWIRFGLVHASGTADVTAWLHGIK